VGIFERLSLSEKKSACHKLNHLILPITSYDSCICLKLLPELQKTQENVPRMPVVKPELVALGGDGGLKLSEKWREAVPV
jgi:hypothetical protein